MVTTEIIGAPRRDLVLGLQRFATKLCISLALFVLLLALGEFASYIYLHLNSVPSEYAGLPLPAGYARELEDSRRTQYLPFVEWRRRQYRGLYISIDAEGVRQTLNSNCQEQKNPVIWIFGDSALWGTGVVDSKTMPSQLAALYQNSGQSVCIKNFGEAGWVTTQEVIELFLQLKHGERRPNIVIFYDGTNDIVMPDPDAPKDTHQAYHRFRELLETSEAESKPGFVFLQKSNTVRALNLILQRINSSRTAADRRLPQSQAEAAAQESIHNYEQNMDIVDALARSYGFLPIYVWYPTSSAGKKPLTIEEQNALRAEAQASPARLQVKQATYALFGTLKRPNFFYLGDALDNENRWLYLDSAHLSSEGNGLMAEKIFEILKTRTASAPQ